MSNVIYTKAKEAILTANVDWVDDTIKVVLVDTALYTPSTGTHTTLANIPVGARVSTSNALTGKLVTNGVVIADGATFDNAAGATAEAIVIYKEGANDAASPLLIYIDAADYLPITPNGGDIYIEWNGGTGEIFSI